MKITRRWFVFKALTLLFFLHESRGGKAGVHEHLVKSIKRFLEIWLIEQQPLLVATYLTAHPIPCFSFDDNNLSNAALKKLFLSVLSKTIEELGKRRSLATAIEAIETPGNPLYKDLNHSERKNFSLVLLPANKINNFLCKADLKSLKNQGIKVDKVYLVTFSFKLPDDKKGGLELIWVKQRSKWKILSFDAVSI